MVSALFRRRQQTDPHIERFARALDSGTSLSSDPEIDRMVEVSRAVAPNVYPREAHRQAVKERILRLAASNAAGVKPPADPAVTGPGRTDGSDCLHATEVTDPLLGLVTIADVEPVDDDRARRIAAAFADLAEGVEGTDR